MTISFIGCGNMGEAILSGIRREAGRCVKCVVCEPRGDRRSFLKKKYGVFFAATPREAVAGADVVFLAVKPQDLGAVLADISGNSKALFVSIAAGITSRFIEKALGGKPRVVRTMPNLPAMIGEGVTALAAGRYAAPKDLKRAQSLMNAVGATVLVKESMIDGVTAVSGSGPAYVFLFVECLMAAASKLGFNEEEARALVVPTLLGSAHLLAKSKDSPAELRQKVTSRGGTTQAATDVFMDKDVFGVYASALKAAKNRAKELST